MNGNGYRVTDIGFLPTEWQVTLLGEAVQEGKETLNPLDYPNEVFEYYSIPAYQENQSPIFERGSRIQSLKLLISDDTVLFGKLNPRVEKVWLVKSKSPYRKIASTEFIPLLGRKEKTDPLFLYYLCWSAFVMQEAKGLVSGSTPSRQRVDASAFRELSIPLPSLPEQKKIAAILSKIQQAIGVREKIIERTKELKNSLMAKLFTEGLHREELKETEIGLKPMSWKVANLDLISSKLKAGGTPNTSEAKFWNGDIPFAKVEDVAQGQKYLFRTLYTITEEGLKNSNAWLVPAESVLLSMYGTAGAVVIAKVDVALSQNVLGIIPKKDVTTEYLYYALNYAKGFILSRIADTTIFKHFTLSKSKGIPLPLPPLGEQQDIASIFSALDQKINNESKKQASLKFLFKSLLSQLMTGQIRVTNIKIPSDE